MKFGDLMTQISALNTRYHEVYLIGIFGEHIHTPQRKMSPNCGDLMTFPLVPPSGQTFIYLFAFSYSGETN